MRFAPFPWLRSLTTQLLLTYTAALLIMMCATVGFLWLNSRQDVGIPTQQQLHKMADLVRDRLSFDSSGVPQDVPLSSEWHWVFRDFATDAKYRVLDHSGRPIVSSDKEPTALTPPGRPFDPTLDSFTTATSGGEPLLVRTEPMIQGTQTYYIQVAVTKRFSAFVRAITGRVRVSDALLLAFVSVILVTVVVYFTLLRVLRPLRRTSAAAAQIDERNLSKRLATQQLPSEFLPVITAFNLTLDRLEKGYNAQRAFLADAAHELKTPLALLRAQIELDGTTDRQGLLEELDRIARQVNQLLHLAEASEPQNYVFESIDLAELAEDVTDYLRRLAQQHEVYVEIRCLAARTRVQADRGASFMLLKNLVENAIQHSPTGGAVVVEIAEDRLSVRDEGPGIPADALPELFKRFWRGQMRRNDGAGLGLSICKEIATAHHWEITVRGVEPGAQFTVLFTLPAAMDVRAA